MQYVQTIKLVLSLLPLIIQLVRSIEEALPESGQGAAKLTMVRSALEAGYKMATDAVISFEEAWPQISNVISAVVTMFNVSGVFKK